MPNGAEGKTYLSVGAKIGHETASPKTRTNAGSGASSARNRPKKLLVLDRGGTPGNQKKDVPLGQEEVDELVTSTDVESQSQGKGVRH